MTKRVTPEAAAALRSRRPAPDGVRVCPCTGELERALAETARLRRVLAQIARAVGQEKNAGRAKIK